MAYKLRFIQRFKHRKTEEFLEIEKKFEQFEKDFPEFPKGKRFLPHSGKLPHNTLIWECDFDSLEELQKAHDFLMNDDRHEQLFKEQSQYIMKTYTEIYKPYDN